MKYLIVIFSIFFLLPSCKKDDSCTDGILNGDEIGIDCGGSECISCVTCFDGVQNGTETGVDCGGDCGTCYIVGDQGPGGGIIFFDKGIFSDGWQYLESTRSDQAESAQWGCRGLFIGNTLVDIGYGNLNTKLVTDKCFPDFLFSGDPDFRLAFYYSTRLSLNGKEDWFLPSKEELLKMYQLKNTIGGFTNGAYWSSSEVRAEDAWIVEFSNGDTYDEFKSRKSRVRAIRRF